MEILAKEFFAFIKNNSVSAFSKLLLGITIFLSIIFIDNISGFSYYSNIDNKLISLEKVTKLLENKSLDEKTKANLLEIQKEIINRKTLYDKITDKWSRISFTDSNNEITNELDSSTKFRNSTLEFISLNYFWIICFFTMPFYWVTKPLVNKFWKNLLIVLVAEISIALFSFGLFFIFSLIPTILNQPIYNYLLNFLLVTAALTLNTIRLNKKNKGYN